MEFEIRESKGRFLRLKPTQNEVTKSFTARELPEAARELTEAARGLPSPHVDPSLLWQTGRIKSAKLAGNFPVPKEEMARAARNAG